jgi:polyhydroxybutyrate depolymerase
MRKGTGVSRTRDWRLRAVIALIMLPAIVALTSAVSFYSTNRSNRTLVSSGIERDYELYVPKSYDARRPTPLVISMHGAGLWGVQQRIMTRFNAAADKYGFIVAYPSGSTGSGPRVWHEDNHNLRDVRFISDLIDTLESQYNVDRDRIYANGLSNGGGMTFVLSCILPRRIAAFGVVASAQLLSFNWCADSMPAPMIDIHGTADPVAPYHGGFSWITSEMFPSQPAFVWQWARRNRCAGPPVDTRIASDVTRRQYTGCARGADVAFYTIEGGGHTWPGGEPLPESWMGPTNTSIDADSVLWEFYQRHPLVK